MAWHILHGLLEQVRVHSTFPGKLWIIVMFIFRIVVVARIGDNVYHDEQSSFICNTLTPGCTNVCFNKFSPISQLRFWSLMILVVSTPSILFFIYGSHKMYHATVKFPFDDETNNDATKSEMTESSSIPTVPPYLNPPNLKRKRRESYPTAQPTAPPLYTVKQISSAHSYENTKSLWSKSRTHLRNRRNKRMYTTTNIKLGDDFPDKLNSPDSFTQREDRIQPWMQFGKPNGYPIYDDSTGRKVEFIKSEKIKSEEERKKEIKEFLKHPVIYRAYWWHVVIRTALEGGFLYLQYFLYGLNVAEKYECKKLDPCTQITDCFVSRPMEKTCLLWLMYGLGAISCILSAMEFWSLGWERFRYAFCCRGHNMTYEEKRKTLAELSRKYRSHQQHHHSAPTLEQPAGDEILLVHTGKGFTSELSLDSFSSETTVESV